MNLSSSPCPAAWVNFPISLCTIFMKEDSNDDAPAQLMRLLAAEKIVYAHQLWEMPRDQLMVVPGITNLLVDLAERLKAFMTQNAPPGL